jgi:TctA family transporter
LTSRPQPTGSRAVRRGTWLLGVGILVVIAAFARTPAGRSGTAAPVAGQVPASLQAVESGAEDVIEAALRSDRAHVVAISARLTAAAGGSATALDRAGVPQARIAQLVQRAKRVSALAPRGSYLAIMLAANAVSALLPELYRRFSGPVPALLLELDYLDRDAQFSLARRSEGSSVDRGQDACAHVAAAPSQSGRCGRR